MGLVGPNLFRPEDRAPSLAVDQCADRHLKVRAVKPRRTDSTRPGTVDQGVHEAEVQAVAQRIECQAGQIGDARLVNDFLGRRCRQD